MTALPGLTPRSPVTMVGVSVLVTVEPPRTAKLCEVPRDIGPAVAGSHVSFVQKLLSSQAPSLGVCTQVPFTQVSVVHTIESLQLTAVCVHPVAGSHASVVHASLSLQLTAVYVHPVAGSHASVVHALLSFQLIAAC